MLSETDDRFLPTNLIRISRRTACRPIPPTKPARFAQFEKKELKKYRENSKRVHPAQREDQGRDGGRRTHFDRIRHMMPERDRLARTLFLREPLRSSHGISAMQDLIALRTNDSRVAYQEALRPKDGHCGVCHQEMET